MRVKILINISSLKYPLTGIGYYTFNIVRELLSRDIDLVAVKDGSYLNSAELNEFIRGFQNNLSESNHDKITKNLRNFLVKTLRSIPGIYNFKRFILSLKLRHTLNILSNDGYVYFEPNFIPFDYQGKTITTIHDLSFIAYPEFHPANRVKYLKKSILKSIYNSDYIVVDSNYIMSELISFSPLVAEKSSTLYLGVDHSFKPISKDIGETILETLGLESGKFILSVCTLEPRKNLTRLIEAYKLLPHEIRNQYPLVLSGEGGWKNKVMVESAKPLMEMGQLKFTGYLSDNDIKNLYSSAFIFAYPSLYEGFGLPVIEAMSSGVPVLTSSRGATLEVASDAAFLVDPESIQSIKNGLITLITDQSMRDKMIENGKNRADIFTWAHTVDRLIAIVESV